MNIALILAGGVGSRLRTDGFPKQYIEIEGKPVLIYTLEKFQVCRDVDKIVVVANEQWKADILSWADKFGISKLCDIAEPGETRQDSVFNGLLACEPHQETAEDIVLIHDAARCLIMTEDIDRVIKETYRTGAAIAAKKATDTIKKTDSHGFITETVDRSALWLAQTPQAFKKSVYEVALAKAQALDANVTDDAMLVSNAGFRVKVVECRNENIKITTPEDIPIATTILEKRRQQKETKKGADAV